MIQEPKIEDVRNKVYELVNTINNATAPSTITQFQPQLIGLSEYLSSYDTQQLIKWNFILSVSTVILAIATVFLAIITYMKP